MKKKKWKKPILIPEAEKKLNQLRYEVAKKLGLIRINEEDWWEALTPMEKSKVNGEVTKLMIANAQIDFMRAYQQNK